MPINRIVATPRGKAAVAGAATAVALATTVLIQPWEGLVLRSHWDRYAKIWDICYGEAKGVGPGMRKTKEECDAMLAKRVAEDFEPKIRACVKNYDRLPMSLQASLISLGYNVGTGAACKSKAVRFAEQGQYRQACEAATAFNLAGKGPDRQVVTGLVKRREMGDATRIGEAELCVSGL